ncbi:MAG TPA: PH domain-containing protein, partial [Nocardioidaceae bacterium]|nr:PH domain-containing protein [Nocardioidaceae bacterium]
MTDPVSKPAVELRRLHPLTPILGSKRLIVIAGAFGFSIFRDDLDRLRWIWDALHGDLELGVLAKGALVLLAVAGASVFVGWLSWRVTGFAIVDDASGVSTLLYHRGLIVRQRRQVRLNRVQSIDVIQPFVARAIGLAALRLDMAAGDEASVDLAYLRQAEAAALREEILRHTSTGTRPTQPGGDGSADVAGPGEPLVARVDTGRLVVANLLEGILGWVFAIVWVLTLIGVAVTWGTAALVAALSGIVPVTLAVLAQTRREVRSIFRDAHFRLHRTPTGVRINSGLTSTINRTIDFDRIQGVQIEEPYLWRRLGWARVRLDIAGATAKATGEHGVSMMPVTDRAAAVALVTQVVGVDLDGPQFSPAGGSARWLDPLGWRYLGVALLDSGAVRRRGRWRRSVSYVPFARVQSVSAEQGLLQRRLDLATVHLD